MRVLGTTLVAFFVLASTAAAAPHSCSRPGSKTLLATPHVRVYQWYDRSRTVDAVSACMYSVGKAWEIGNVWEYATSYSRVRLDVLRRQYLAYTVSVADIHDQPQHWAAVLVRDLRTGRVLHAVGRRGYDVHVVVMDRFGSAAWTGTLTGPDQGYARVPEVRRFESARGRYASRLLDRGSAVDVNSLALRPGRVEWLHDGEPRSAPLR